MTWNKEIIIDPSDEILNKHLEESDIIAIIHGFETPEEIIDYALNYAEEQGFEVVYIHHYSIKNDYTMGLKEIILNNI